MLRNMVNGGNLSLERGETGLEEGEYTGQLLPLRPAGFSSAKTESRTDQE